MCVCFFPKARFGFAQRVQGCIWPSAPHCSPSNQLGDESKQHRGAPRGHSLCVCVYVCVRCSASSHLSASRAYASAQAERRPPPPARKSRSARKNCRQLPRRRPRGSFPFSKIHGYFKNISSFKLSCLDNLHYSSVSRLMAPSHGAK